MPIGSAIKSGIFSKMYKIFEPNIPPFRRPKDDITARSGMIAEFLGFLLQKQIRDQKSGSHHQTIGVDCHRTNV
jgi:hypothetical protein